MPDMWRIKIRVCLLMSYRIEIQNVKVPTNKELQLRINCKNLFMIPVFLIPGVECPFRGLGLNHDNGGRT